MSPAGIVSWSAASSLGMTAAQTGFFLRAGKNHFRLSPFIDTWGERVTMAYLATLPPTLTGVRRLLQLALDALSPVLTGVEERRCRQIKVALALPERFAAQPGSASKFTPDGAGFVHDLEQALPRYFKQVLPRTSLPRRVECWPAGRAGGVFALQQAINWLDRGEADFVVVGGVDSDYDWEVVKRIVHDDRLLTQDNLDGYIPGEGAAFIGLSRDPAWRATARFGALGVGQEPTHVLSEEPCRAKGMTEALNRAVAPLRSERCRSNFWITDLTHESYGVKEFQTVLARFGDVLGTDTVLQTPLRELGNIGAATLPMFWALAAEAWHRGYAPDRFAVCMAGSDAGARGAAVLEGISA